MGLPELYEYVATRHGVFSRAEAFELGLSQTRLESRIRIGHFVRLERAVYMVAGSQHTWHQQARVAALTTQGFVSHRAAAAAHQIDGFPLCPIEVTIPKSRSLERTNFALHRTTQFSKAGVVEVSGIPVSGVPRTLLDVAATTSNRRLEQAVDAALRQELCELSDLFDVYIRHSIQGRNGCGRTRQLLDERNGADPIPDSQWNRMVGRLLSDAGVPTPRYEFEISNLAGRLLGRVDLAFPEQRVAIELDSVRWHLNRESFERDPRRKNNLMLAGWTVLTFTWADYADTPMQLIRTVRSALGH